MARRLGRRLRANDSPTLFTSEFCVARTTEGLGCRSNLKCRIVFKAMVGPRDLPFKEFADLSFGQSNILSGDMSANIHNSESGDTYRVRVSLARQHSHSRRPHGVFACSRPEWVMGITQKRRSHFTNATTRSSFMTNAWP